MKLDNDSAIFLSQLHNLNCKDTIKLYKFLKKACNCETLSRNKNFVRKMH